MVTHGKGGWTFSDLYEMPIFLRNYYFKKMNDLVEREDNVNKPVTPDNKPGPKINTRG